MIDHISIGVSDLEASIRFYDPVLETLGMKPLMRSPSTIGYGKAHPEFWLNRRSGMPPVALDTGIHICLRTPAKENVDAFHAAALAAGGTDDGGPGFRPEYHETYYAAFIRDPDGNRIEAVTFIGA